MIILATLCYVKKKGKTLMLHRVKKENDIHEGKWNGLGGKLLPGESPEQGVIREVKEESGLTIRNPRMKGIITFPEFDGANDWYVFVFQAIDQQGDLLEESNEGILEWIKDSELLNLDLWEGDRIFLPWLEERPFFSARFHYREGRLIDHSVVFYSV